MTESQPERADHKSWALSRPIGLCLDALICTRAPLPGSLRELWSRGGLHPRFESLSRLLDRHAPSLTRRIIQAILRDVDVDGHSHTAEPMDRGRAVTVYRLQEKTPLQGTPEKPLVLKVYRSALGLRGQKLHQLQSNIQLGIDQLERWYGNSEGMLVTARLVRIKSPILRIHSLALVQPLVSTKAEDFFRDYADAELLEMLSSDTALHKQFNEFVLGTRIALQEGTRCFDMHGQKNLSVLTTPEGKRLCIVDYGVYDLAERQRKSPKAYAEILQFHSRLFALHEQLSKAAK